MTSLRQHLLFASLNDQQFSQVEASSSNKELTEGSHLFHQQQAANYFYYLQSGDIKLYRLSPNGEEKVIELIQPGQTFAEAVMFMQTQHYPVHAQAITDCQLVQIKMDSFRQLLDQSPETCMKILAKMSQRLHGSIQEIDQLTLQNATMRVIQFMLQGISSDSQSPCEIQWAAPKATLASRLSVRPETFSRILKQLSHEGLIQVQGKTISILDLGALRQYL
ncbi:MAG: Crp/Fnr family transcriptional regulator [Cycloclasticus sp.]|nr:Crp/Fnr family transcriptional regulator [Cycloclasticus sp.]